MEYMNLTKSPSSYLKKGFTLIEIVTVIAIMGVLGTVITVSLMGARARGRDAQRLSTLQQMRAAIDQYAVDKGHYPITNGWAGFDPTNVYYNQTVTGPTAINIVSALKPYTTQASFIDPSGPTGAGNDDGYIYNSNGTDYAVWSYKRPEKMTNFTSDLINMNRCKAVVNDQCDPSVGGVNAVGFWSKNAANW